MNAPIRRLSFIVTLLFASLLISSTLIQYVYAAKINTSAPNRRTLLATFAKERGAIVVGDTTIAKSVPTSDQYKFQRVYSDPKTYAHVTGYFSIIGSGGGLESAQNGLLAGTADSLFYRRISDTFTGRKPAGATLLLTLDPRVQKAAVAGIGNQRGAAVALDPRTGAILALVSNPSYDPNAIAVHDSAKANAAYQALLADPNRPLDDRAIGGRLYPPGSTFKVVTAAAALASGGYTAESELEGPAVLDLPQTSVGLPNANRRSCGPGDKVTLLVALQNSCNTAFGWLGMQLGAETLRGQAAKFGIGDELRIPMKVTPSRFPATLSPPQLAQSAIGQYDVAVSPLQMAMVAAGVANRGTVMRPYLVKSVIGSDATTIDSATPEVLAEAVTPEVAATLTTMMEAVVDNGTGHRAQIPGVKVAGKTGTAEHATGKPPHAWFISFAPADNPTIAVAVVVEDGGDLGDEAAGGVVSAPIARQMMEAYLR